MMLKAMNVVPCQFRIEKLLSKEAQTKVISQAVRNASFSKMQSQKQEFLKVAPGQAKG